MRLVLIILILAASAIAQPFPTISHYDLRLHMQLAEQRMTGTAILTLENESENPIQVVPLLMYRLLSVSDVRDESGQGLTWHQDVVTMADENTWQVNEATVTLPAPLASGAKVTLHVDYSGSIFGYPEIMQYTRDRIGEEYSLIRNDVLAYPLVTTASTVAHRMTYDDHFTYAATVTVPSGYTVACGGALTGTEPSGDSTIYSYKSKAEVTRIDLAVARFELLVDSLANLRVYYLPRDSAGARNVLVGMKDAIAAYHDWFGAAPGFAGYTVIEIPDGWGSQAGKFYILQTAAAFADSSRINEVYHEVGHSWNARADRSVQRSRYFDEAFASYFEALCLKRFRGDSIFEADMASTRDWYLKRSERTTEGRTVAVADYGPRELGGFSYSKGAYSLWVLHQIMGDESFNRLIRTLLADYSDAPIDFVKWQALAEKIHGRSLQGYFADWIYGVASSQMLADRMPIDSIVARYR